MEHLPPLEDYYAGADKGLLIAPQLTASMLEFTLLDEMVASLHLQMRWGTSPILQTEVQSTTWKGTRVTVWLDQEAKTTGKLEEEGYVGV